MARNLVQEKREEENRVKSEALEAKKEEVKKEEVPQEGKIAVNQVEAVIINRIDILTALLIEGFKQVGVKFEEKEKS
jgi:hypothetical protein